METYYPIAKAGWKFEKWVNHCTAATPPNYDCAFNVPAATVHQLSGQTIAPLKAVFTPLFGGASASAVAPSPRYIEVWSSAYASAAYDLAVVDPDAPGTLIPVDRVPFLGSNAPWMVHIYGGTWDAATSKLVDPGVRHVVYLKNGKIFRVTLDKKRKAPKAKRLSTESAAKTGSLAVVAQNRDGSDALLTYLSQDGVLSVPRYVRLSTPASSAPLAPPQFAAEFTFSSAGWTLDPATGGIATLLWTSIGGGSQRLFRTNYNFDDATSIATFDDLNISAPWINGGFSGGRMAGGRFFVADNALRRYDDATGEVRVVFPDVVGLIAGSTFDDKNAYVRVMTSAGPRLVRAPDTPDSTGVSISSAAVVGNASAFPKQTRNYLVFTTGNNASAVSIRKKDGAQTVLPVVAGLLFSWSGAGAADFVDGNTAGNRVWYTYINPSTGNVVGSIAADGTDRKEFSALGYGTIVQMAPSVAPHRLVQVGAFGAQPYARFLVKVGNKYRWVKAATGELGATVGSVPAGFTVGAQPPFYGFAIGRHGGIGHSFATSALSIQADAWLLSNKKSSLIRLTNQIP